MSKNIELFRLIESMSRSEKRYFKLYASMHTRAETNKYVQLFDLIDHAASEEELEEVLEKEGLQNAEIKHYLYQAILKALHLYTLEESVDGQLDMLCHQAEILFDRQLHDQFRKILAKIKDIAVRYERPLVIMDMIELEYRLLLLERNRANLSGDITTLFEELFNAHALQTSMMQYWRLDAQMLLLTKSIGTRPHTWQERQQYEDIMANEYMQDGEKALSGASRVYYHHVRAIYYDATGAYEAQIEEHKHVLNIIDQSNSMRTPPQAHRCFGALYNICAASIYIGKFDEFFAHYDRLLECTEVPPSHDRYRHYIEALTLLPHVYIKTGEFEKAGHAMQKVICAQQHFQGQMTMGIQHMIHIQEFSIRFGQGQYERCMEPLNAVLCRRSAETSKKDVYYGARLMEILVHFELGHYDVLDSLVRSTHKFLRSRGALYKMESALLSCMRNISIDQDSRAIRTHLEKLYQELLLLLDDPYERNLTGLFDILSWVESKLHGRPFADIIKEKYQGAEMRKTVAPMTQKQNLHETVDYPREYKFSTQRNTVPSVPV